MRNEVQKTSCIGSNQILLLTENRFEAVRHINSFLNEDTWIGIRNFVDTGNGTKKKNEKKKNKKKKQKKKKCSTRYRHMNTVQNPSKSSSDALFYIEPEHDFSRFSILAPFQLQYDIQRDALYVLTKLEEVSTIYVLAHRPISELDKQRELGRKGKTAKIEPRYRRETKSVIY